MKVRATTTGMLNASRVRPGTVFDWEGGKLPSWVEVVEDEPKEPAVPEKRTRKKTEVEG